MVWGTMVINKGGSMIATYKGNALAINIKFKSQDGSPFLVPVGDSLVFTIKKSPADEVPLYQTGATGAGSDAVLIEIGAESLQIAPGCYYIDLFDSTLKRTLLPPYLLKIGEVLYYD